MFTSLHLKSEYAGTASILSKLQPFAVGRGTLLPGSNKSGLSRVTTATPGHSYHGVWPHKILILRGTKEQQQDFTAAYVQTHHRSILSDAALQLQTFLGQHQYHTIYDRFTYHDYE